MKSRFLSLLAAVAIGCIASGPASAQWTTYQGNARHDGYVPMSLDPALMTPLWERDFATTYLNPVTAGNGQVFVSVSGYFSGGMSLQVLDAATGETSWSKTYGQVFSVNPAAYGNGTVYIQTGNHGSDTYLWAYDAITGNQVFKAPFSAQWERYFAPTVYDGRVYINGGYYGGMYSFDGTTGTQNWFRGLNQYDQWTPAVDEKYAYAYTGEYNPSLTVTDRFTGNVVYKIDDPTFNWNGWSMGQTVCLGAHNDAFATNSGRLVCFDLENKKIKWEVTRSFGYGQVTVANGVVYAVDGGKLTAVDELTGEFLWQWTPPSGTLAGTLIATDTHVLASTATDTYAVDLDSRTAAWTYARAGKLALSNRALYIVGSSGRLTAIAVPETAIYPDPPSGLSLKILKPGTDVAHLVTNGVVQVSGTADELDANGDVMGTAHLASVSWTNDRGGSGVGCYDSTWNMPTSWIVKGITLQPGDNVITVTATDLWGNTDTASVTLRTPTAVIVDITDPAGSPHLSYSNPINLAGTAKAVDSTGTVWQSAGLASVTWSNDRGGSGTGTFSGPPEGPTTWSVTGVTLQPGDNVISVTATDLWGNTNTANVTVTAPSGLRVEILNPTTAPSYLTYGSPISLSGTAVSLDSQGSAFQAGCLASIKWTNLRGGSGTGTFVSSSTKPATWQIKDISLYGGNNLITVTGTDLWGNKSSAVITVNWSPGTIGAAKRLPPNAWVNIQNAVVTSNSFDRLFVFVESEDRSSGIRLITDQSLKVGDRVSFTGQVGRVNGEFQISSPNFVSIVAGAPLQPVYMNSRNIGNDLTESLRYTGINPTGLLVRTAGLVTGTVSTQNLFYMDDGGRYSDGVVPVYGLRVRVPSATLIPKAGKPVAVTGILRVEKITLTDWGNVNGDWYPSGSVLYVPTLWVRNFLDVQLLPTP